MRHALPARVGMKSRSTQSLPIKGNLLLARVFFHCLFQGPFKYTKMAEFVRLMASIIAAQNRGL